MSSRGQIVIPQEVRKQMKLKKGEAFAVTGSGDTLLLKRVQMPSKEEMVKKFQEFVERGHKRAKKLGLKEIDVDKLIHRARGIKG